MLQLPDITLCQSLGPVIVFRPFSFFLHLFSFFMFFVCTTHVVKICQVIKNHLFGAIKWNGWNKWRICDRQLLIKCLKITLLSYVMLRLNTGSSLELAAFYMLK